jgi:two-component system sensor histidine kinase AlgZ
MTVMQDPKDKQNEAPMRSKELGETETIRQMMAPTFAPGGETGLFLLGIVISIAFVFASRPATGLSVIIAAEFIAMAVPGCVLAVVLCSRFFSRLNFVVSVLLVFFAVNAVVISAHLAQLYWLGGLDNPMELLLRRMFFTTVLAAFLMRLSTMSHRLRLRKAAEQTAKIQALQSRIRPHFLFNSMNVIASLIPVNPDKAEQVVEDLSELFRASLQRAGTFVRISEELDLCQRYLHIESLRLGERLRVQWQVEAAPAAAEMPLLILQPLLENAIYHGIQPLPEGGTIRVEVYFTDDTMIARITNPLMQEAPAKLVDGDGSPGRPRPPTKGNHIAIDNIRQRLDMVYGESAKLVTKQGSDRFQAELRCPTVPKII